MDQITVELNRVAEREDRALLVNEATHKMPILALAFPFFLCEEEGEESPIELTLLAFHGYHRRHQKFPGVMYASRPMIGALGTRWERIKGIAFDGYLPFVPSKGVLIYLPILPEEQIPSYLRASVALGELGLERRILCV
ncbi:MAG: hypothetical protein J2P36_29040 [Ktedonobacteraceae bacterium]|nr:hypothetical protein [Ktedonobacteraceae bacterium]